MLVNENQTRNWSAVSAVQLSGSEKWDAVMYMNASYNGKDLSFSKSIQNRALYTEHKATVDADYSAFETKVEEEMGM